METPQGIKPDWQVICELSTRMGYAMQYEHPSQIMEEIAQRGWAAVAGA